MQAFTYINYETSFTTEQGVERHKKRIRSCIWTGLEQNELINCHPFDRQKINHDPNNDHGELR